MKRHELKVLQSFRDQTRKEYWKQILQIRKRNFPNFFLDQTVLDEATEPWGIKVERVEM